VPQGEDNRVNAPITGEQITCETMPWTVLNLPDTGRLVRGAKLFPKHVDTLRRDGR
jgi:hypothetical protein